jgi:deazaflavin-dependent oxidoreductase (nitroreductase family)
MSKQSEYNRHLIEEFRANGGKVGGQFANGSFLLLTTTGAKSGLSRTTPLSYLSDGDRWVIVASNAGAVAHPDWYYNLVAHPDAIIEIGKETYDVVAEVARGTERERLWNTGAELYPFILDHQVKAGARQIPLVVLSKRTAG